MSSSAFQPTRRDALRVGIAAGVGIMTTRLPLHAEIERALRMAQLPLVTKPIPSSGDKLPVVGLGTNRYSTTEPERIAQLCEVLDKLAELGGKVVDTARGYGRAEEVIGQCLEKGDKRDRLFLATKFSLGGRRPGADTLPPPDPKAGLDAAFTRLRTDKIDLMMVHNLAGTDALMPLMRELKQAGRFKYVGVSTSSDRQYDDLASLMKKEQLDFIQVDYSIGNRNAGEVILPLAAERGTAVLINVPFGSARVFQKVEGKPVPDWAGEIDCTSWAQVFLKYVVSHPSVTCAIPGTTRVEHAVDNNGASRGRMPDAALRRRIEETFDAM